MEYSYIILLLPMLMFITLGLCGHKMSHRTAGVLGTSGLFIITILSYIVAAQYFLQPRVDGIYPTITPIISSGCGLPIGCTSTWVSCSILYLS